jgi:hypothetical protein
LNQACKFRALFKPNSSDNTQTQAAKEKILKDRQDKEAIRKYEKDRIASGPLSVPTGTGPGEQDESLLKEDP